ncbi:hypothetical protein AB0G04_42615 [Actinoplanes sp. NPDC023801]|uniref:hypothetical protein n=1 Tax=Actinoplanes sp. NPDC023801 TaxID=3154595 RepID=UPI0033E478DD
MMRSRGTGGTMMRRTVLMLTAAATLAPATGCGAAPERVGGAAEPVGGIRPTGTVATSTAATARRTLGPAGVGALKLGMNRAEADATQLADWTGERHDSGCNPEYRLTYGGPDAVVWLSTDLGIASITAYPGLATPQGIELGSSTEAVQAAYPDWRNFTGPGPEGRGHAAVPGNSNAVYNITVDNGEVVALQLELRAQDCYE